MIYTQKQVTRFWQNVAVGQSTDCWNWQRSQNNGYGQVGLIVEASAKYPVKQSRILKAHKVAWEISNDQRIGFNMRASHTCGNRLCCNPSHVVVHSDDDDGAEVNPPRGVHGERHGMAKLTDRQVRIIKYQLNLLTTREVADAFEVASQTIWDIRHSITWKHI